MSAPPVTVTLTMPVGQQKEVWGMDNKDFHDGSDSLVRVVKCPGFVWELTSCYRLTYRISKGTTFTSALLPNSLMWWRKSFVFG